MRQAKLETIVWLNRLGNFRAVAERLNTSQAAISQRVASLEQELGVKLFERNTRGLSLTPKGARLLEYAERIVDLSIEMRVQVTDPSAYSGTIRIGAVETLAHVWLHRLLERIYEVYSGIAVELMVDTSGVLRDAVLKGKLDIAILLANEHEPDLIRKEVCTYQLAWVASPSLGLSGKKLTIEELASLPILTFARHSAPYNMIRDLFRGRGLPPVQLNASGSLATTIKLAANGLGIAMLPPVAIQPELADATLHLVETDFTPPALVYASVYTSPPANPLSEVITEMARSVAADT